MLVWNPKLTTGIPLVDAQHKVLFEQINRLAEMAIVRPLPLEHIERILHFLDSYATSHFHYEEQCMVRHQCPALEENKTCHADFRRTLNVYKGKIDEQGLTEEILKELLGYLSKWVFQHVVEVDQKLHASVIKVPTTGN